MTVTLDECRFHQKMLEFYDRAATECDWRASRFLQMVRNRGGLAAAKKLLRTAGPSKGLARLAELGRLDISVEALVCQEPWRSLFTEAEVEIAERRLSAILASPLPPEEALGRAESRGASPGY
jgi:hypothetical protein